MLKEKKKKQKHNTHITDKKLRLGQQIKHHLGHNIRKNVNFKNTRICMGPLNDEIKLQNDEMNKILKELKNP